MVDKKVKSTKWNSKEKPCLKCGTSSNWHSHRSHCWSAHQICGKCSMKNFECNLCRTHSPILGKKMPPFTEEHRKNLSKAMIGRPSVFKGKTHSPESKNLMSIAKKGKPSPIKGKPKSENHKKNLSIALTGKPSGRKGKKMSEESLANYRIKIQSSLIFQERNKKISIAKKGVKLSPEHIKNNANARKGISPWCKGLTKETDERLARVSKKMTGRKMNKEWRDNISKARKGKPLSKEHIENIIKSVPYKNSKPERMMHIALALNGIKFEKQKMFKLGNRWHPVDIFIEPNICVEVDGVHWHLEKKDVMKDMRQTQELTIMGYHVIRIRDKDILKDANKCSEKVIKLIKELQYSRFSLNQNP